MAILNRLHSPKLLTIALRTLSSIQYRLHRWRRCGSISDSFATSSIYLDAPKVNALPAGCQFIAGKRRSISFSHAFLSGYRLVRIR